MYRSLVVVLALVVLASCELRANIQLSSASNTHVAGQALRVHWELFNEQELPEHLLSWSLPGERWDSRIFSIVSETGAPALYIGREVKRITPSAEHFMALNPGASHSGEVNLATGYQFQTVGKYYVTLQFSVPTLRGSRVQIRSNTLELEVLVADEPYDNTYHRQSRIITYSGCDATEQPAAANAAALAIVSAQNALNYFSGQSFPPSCTSAYTPWFGVYSDPNWVQIRNDYQNIFNLMSGQNFGITCGTRGQDPSGCPAGVYAYVYPADTSTHTIHVCDQFFLSGPGPYTTDSQAGTLIHESSHFDDIAATNDNAYGQAACLALATSNVALAINNADSHEYFAESQPTCITGGGGGDPHIFSFAGEDIEMNWESGKKYLFFGNDDLRVVIQVSSSGKKMFITDFGVIFHEHHLLGRFNDTEPVFYLDDQLIEEPIATPFGTIEVFVPRADTLRGVLSLGSKFISKGMRIGTLFEVVGGYSVSGPFFDLQIEREAIPDFGLLEAVSDRTVARDADLLAEFEVETFF